MHGAQLIVKNDKHLNDQIPAYAVTSEQVPCDVHKDSETSIHIIILEIDNTQVVLLKYKFFKPLFFIV